ncbi:MAG: hypothetical protein ACOYXT_29165 [Bacteroidota bacterium]
MILFFTDRFETFLKNVKSHPNNISQEEIAAVENAFSGNIDVLVKIEFYANTLLRSFTLMKEKNI